MKQILVMIAVVVLVGCSNDARKAEPLPAPEPVPQVKEKVITIADPLVEKTVRGKLGKPEGELTESDLEKVRSLSLTSQKITDASPKDVAKLQSLEYLTLGGTKNTDAGLKEVAKLQNLKTLSLRLNQVTKAGVAELQVALPNLRISGP